MFKVNNKNIRKRCEICLKLTIKRPFSSISTVYFEQAGQSIYASETLVSRQIRQFQGFNLLPLATSKKSWNVWKDTQNYSYQWACPPGSLDLCLSETLNALSTHDHTWESYSIQSYLGKLYFMKSRSSLVGLVFYAMVSPSCKTFYLTRVRYYFQSIENKMV